MDNVCHTLVGAALANVGLRRRTALGAATLMIGANLPDIDVVAVPLGHSVEWRRGVTHGVLALVVLPFVLAGIMMLWDRLVRRRGGREPAEVAHPRQLLLLAALSILTHPVLDWMNVYGMRWLMPFSGRWFYGDALFIVDPWMWLALGAGAWLARRRWRRHRRGKSGAAASDDAIARPARIALALTTAYVAAMLALAIAGERTVRRALAARGDNPGARLMVAPVPATPFRRQVVVEDADRYRTGTLTWSPGPRVALDGPEIPINRADPAARAAAATPQGRAFLGWSRFPFYVIERRPEGTLVRIADARYTSGASDSWATVTVRLPAAVDGR